jgi:hypothetical protein
VPAATGLLCESSKAARNVEHLPQLLCYGRMPPPTSKTPSGSLEPICTAGAKGGSSSASTAAAFTVALQQDRTVLPDASTHTAAMAERPNFRIASLPDASPNHFRRPPWRSPADQRSQVVHQHPSAQLEQRVEAAQPQQRPPSQLLCSQTQHSTTSEACKSRRRPDARTHWRLLRLKLENSPPTSAASSAQALVICCHWLRANPAQNKPKRKAKRK